MSSSTSESSKNDSKSTSSKESIDVKDQANSIRGKSSISYPNYFDDFFETFRQNIPPNLPQTEIDELMNTRRYFVRFDKKKEIFYSFLGNRFLRLILREKYYYYYYIYI